MLILSRKLGESIQVGENVVIRVVELRRSRVRIGIDAPTSVRIQREEHVELEHRVGTVDDLSLGEELMLGSAAGSC